MRVPAAAPFLLSATLVAALIAAPASTAPPPLRLLPYTSGFSLPVAFVQDPSDARVQFVVQQGGRIRTVVSGQVQAADFLDLSGVISTGGERGLLGMAIQPDNPSRVFLDFTDPAGNTVVARFTRVAGNSRALDPATRLDLRWSTGLRYIQQPYTNHNGGCLMFGPDGYLYVGMGDGGSGGDPDNRAQDPSMLLGKILRVDVAVADGDPAGFRVPADNPFVASSLPGVRPEIWAFGVRNPWRFSFDLPSRGGTGALIIGDVGQGSVEEVDYEPAGSGGRNYGWPNREGSATYDGTRAVAFLPLTNPVFEYNHSVGNSITGGYVYRGNAEPALRGRYFFADYVRGRIWSVVLTPSGATATASDLYEHTADMGVTGNISSFGIDAAGELYAVNYAQGVVGRISSGVPLPPVNLRIIRGQAGGPS